MNFLKIFSVKVILLSFKKSLKSFRVKKFLEFLSRTENNFFSEKLGDKYNFERIVSI